MNNQQEKKEKIRKVELVVGVSMIIFLAYIFLMQVLSAKKAARMAICAGNLKQIGLVLHMYSQDYNNWLLPAYSKTSNEYWFQILKFYLSETEKCKILICPSDKNHIWRGTNYVYNGHYGDLPISGGPSYLYHPRKVSDFKHPEDSLLLMDGKTDVSPLFTQSNYTFCIDIRHKDMNGNKFLYVLWVDGSVKGADKNPMFTNNQFYGH